MKTFWYWAAVAALCFWAVAPLVVGLSAGWIFFYSPLHNHTLETSLGFMAILSLLLTGPTIVIVRYIWPRR